MIIRIVGMAPDAGFEPATKWLTATYSTAELIRNKYQIKTKLYINFYKKSILIGKII